MCNILWSAMLTKSEWTEVIIEIVGIYKASKGELWAYLSAIQFKILDAYKLQDK